MRVCATVYFRTITVLLWEYVLSERCHSKSFRPSFKTMLVLFSEGRVIISWTAIGLTLSRAHRFELFGFDPFTFKSKFLSGGVFEAHFTKRTTKRSRKGNLKGIVEIELPFDQKMYGRGRIGYSLFHPLITLYSNLLPLPGQSLRVCNCLHGPKWSSH